MEKILNQRLNARVRWAAALFLLVTAATHIPLVPEHMEEAPYVGVLFIALSVVSILLAALVVVWDTPVVWVTVALTTGLAVVAFLISRTVGLPQIGADIGNWTEPLGFPAVAAEAMAVIIAVLALNQRSEHPARRPREGTS